MRVVVVGATGNTGSSVLPLLAEDPRVDSILGVARRRPDLSLPKTEWATADIGTDNLDQLLKGADVVVHLAWLIQPSHDEAALARVNVHGSRRLLDAIARSSVRALVYASSVGAYSPGPKDRSVDEHWPTDGVATSFYSRHKAAVERLLDTFEERQPEIRVVRLRPGLIFKREAATGIRRLFAGPFLPGGVLRRARVPVVPVPAGLRFQAVHTEDVAEAYRRAVVRDVRGAFNVAADDPIDAEVIAGLLAARPLVVPPRVARTAVAGLWHLRLQPTPPGWLDLALSVPLMNCGRARTDLGWSPSRRGADALAAVLGGLRDGANGMTPPLAGTTSGPARLREVASGIGTREG